MKRSTLRVLFMLGLSVVAASQARAWLTDWFLSRPADWTFIQETGGIRILPPREIGGKRVLPVVYDASGRTEVTRRPVRTNSVLVVDRIRVRRSGHVLVVGVLTSLRKDTGSTEGMGQLHYADLSGVPGGTYDVFYGRADDPAAQLGRVQIK